jgi:hypothetical protein
MCAKYLEIFLSGGTEMATNNEFFAHISFVKALLDSDNIDTLKKVIDEIYYNLGGRDKKIAAKSSANTKTKK